MKNLVFISKGMPNNIKSAGDIRALRMLKILKHEYDITVIASGADFGEGDVRGIGCESHLTSDINQIIKEKSPEVIILSHWTIAGRYLDLIKNISNAKIIIDTIDIEFLRLQREIEYRKLGEVNQQNVNNIKNNELNIYKKADLLITTSKPDKEELLKHSEFKIIELPCLFTINDSYQVNDGNNTYTINNWLHKPNVDSTIYLCEKIIPKLDIPLYVIGKHPPESVVKYSSDKIIVCGAEYEINKFLLKMNILLAPILYGAGMNGKIGEALAFGIPVVTTSLGAKPYELEHKKNAMISDDEGSFIDSVKQILENENLRTTLSSNGRKLIENYTIENWKNKFLGDLK